MEEYCFYKSIVKAFTAWWEKISGKQASSETIEEMQRRVERNRQADELRYYSKKWLTYWD